MALTGGFVVVMRRDPRKGAIQMESYAGADVHKRLTQLAVLKDGQPPSQFRFLNDAPTVDGVLKKLPKGTKIAVEATGSFDG